MDGNEEFDNDIRYDYLTTDEYGVYDLHATEDEAREAAEAIARQYSTTRKVFRLVEVARVTGEKTVHWSTKKKAPVKRRKAAKKSVKRKN